jgi:hypothetical protein
MKFCPLPENIRDLLAYDPETGILTRLVRTSNRIKVGDVAGSFSKTSGYINVRVNGKLYLAQRIAWFLHYGVDPGETRIDHEDTDGANNRITNLRKATNGQNRANSTPSCESGMKGAYRLPSGRYQASITVNENPIYLGSFDTAEEAHAAYMAAANVHFGEYARAA